MVEDRIRARRNGQLRIRGMAPRRIAGSCRVARQQRVAEARVRDAWVTIAERIEVHRRNALIQARRHLPGRTAERGGARINPAGRRIRIALRTEHEWGDCERKCAVDQPSPL